MKLNILEHTESCRGDHGSDVAVAHDYIPGETVGALVRRCFSRLESRQSRHGVFDDHIEIRIIIESQKEGE